MSRMNNLNIFEALPQGFRFIENGVERRLVALTIAQAFADSAYPLPSCPISHKDMLKLYFELGLRWIDNAGKCGLVLTNDDFSGVLILTTMKDALDVEKIIREDSTYDYLTPEARENLLYIFASHRKDEESLEYNDDDIYGEILAVQTPRQGQKIASMLMRGMFAECDRVGKDIYLVTSPEKNIRIYEHYGYKIIKEMHINEIDSHAFIMKRKCNAEFVN